MWSGVGSRNVIEEISSQLLPREEVVIPKRRLELWSTPINL